MIVDIHSLYRIVGEEGPALQVVRRVFGSLVSSQLRDITERLLVEAHALHGKPLKVTASTTECCHYTNANGIHQVVFNPQQVAVSKIVDAEGIGRSVVPEAVLAHEMKHAGQREVLEGVPSQLSAFELAARIHVRSKMTAGAIKGEQYWLLRATFAEEYYGARECVARYVDALGMQEQRAVYRELQANPAYRRFLEAVEGEAMRVESQVSQLLGGPIRDNYFNGLQHTRQEERDKMIDRIMVENGFDKKPKELLKAKRTWVTSLSKRSGRQIE